jgi:hypothetical protein
MSSHAGGFMANPFAKLETTQAFLGAHDSFWR